MKRVIRLGDPTTHGGTVVSASPTVIINGKPVARLGDSVTCPLPGHGVVTIIEGDPNWLVDGRPVALEGHKTSCGAALISTLPSVWRSPLGAGSGSGTGAFVGGVASGGLLSVFDSAIGAVSFGDARKPDADEAVLRGAGGSPSARASSSCPRSVDMSSMQKEFDQLWSNSFPGGASQEQGGVIVSDASGKMRLTNMSAGTSGSFSPNLSVAPGEKVEGIFHTHPYDSTEGGHTGVSLSGGDAAYLINGKQNFIVAQSGEEQFMYMRTDATLPVVDSIELNSAQNGRIAELLDKNTSFSEASRIAAQETAKTHGLAYYEGRKGVLNLVEP